MGELNYLKEELIAYMGRDAHRVFDFLDGGSVDGIWYWDLENLENKWVSPRFWRILGYDAESGEQLSLQWEELIHPDDREVATATFERHCENPDFPYEHNTRFRHKDGSTVWIRCRGFAIRDDAGKAVRLFGVHNDITSLRRHEGERFRRLVELAPNAMVKVDRNGRIVLVNRRTEDMFGYERDELVGHGIDKLVPHRYREQHAGFLRTFFTDPKMRAMGAGRELFGLRKDGTEVPIEIGLNPIDTPFGLHVLASIIDITERKRAQGWFQTIVESAPYATIVVDKDRRITLANRSAEILFGYSLTELVGQRVEMLLPHHLREQHANYIAEFLREPRSRKMGGGRYLAGRRKDGSEVPVEIGLTIIEGPDGMSTLASIIDITERKQWEDELRRSNAELSQFAYVASHDLQEPLRMVANYTELLAQRYAGKLDDKADKYIRYASDGARRMQGLVADLLAYSRVGSQGKPMVPVDAGVVVGDVLKSLQRLIRDAHASVVYDELPWVMADEVQLRQLFQNLIGNAIKFRAEATPKVVIEAQPEGPCWRFSVADNGIGLDMQYAERVFQMFQRLHALGKYDGSGIGLSIAKRIVERHGGNIWLESELGVGTTFYFSLQRAPRDTT